MMNTRLKYIFLLLAALGVIVPYMALVPWMAEHGLDIPRLIEQASANRIAAFAWLDVVISAVALLIAAYSKQFISLKQAWIITVLTLLAGVSAGLPMLFYFALTGRVQR